MVRKVCNITEENWVACLITCEILSVMASLSSTIYLWIYGDFTNLPDYAEPIWDGLSFGAMFIALICGCAMMTLMSRKDDSVI